MSGICIAFLVFKLCLIYLLIRFIVSIYTQITAGRCWCSVYLGGKTALITGGNAGLGYRTALELAGRGCRVIIADKDNSDATRDKIIKITGNTNIITKQFDLVSLSSVRKLAKEINDTEEKLDFLINNAGSSGLGNSYTEDGLHVGMQVNYFGSFLLTHLLIDKLKKSAPSRIIFVSSFLSFVNNLSSKNLNYPENGPVSIRSQLAIYCNSKLCAIIAAKELAIKLMGTGVTANALNPGGVADTKIFHNFYDGCSQPSYLQILYQHIISPFKKRLEEGVQTIIHVVLSKECAEVSGKYFSDCKISREPAKAKSALFRKKIWDLTEKLVKLNPEEILN